MRLNRLVTLAAVIFFAAAGCGSKSDSDLAALRHERIATQAVAGTTQTGRDESGSGTALGKQHRATLSRRLAVNPGADPAAVLAAAVRQATGDGWTPRGGPPPEGGAWLFDKTVNGQHLQLDLSIQTLDGTATLVINLTNLQ